MMFFVVLFVFLTSATAQDQQKRCLLYKRQCVEYCPKDMHPYHTRCDIDTLSQRTCTRPDVTVLGFTCGWSRCDCNAGLLMTEESLCVEPKECPLLKRRPAWKPPLRKRKKLTPRVHVKDPALQSSDKDNMPDEIDERRSEADMHQ